MDSDKVLVSEVNLHAQRSARSRARQFAYVPIVAAAPSSHRYALIHSVIQHTCIFYW